MCVCAVVVCHFSQVCCWSWHFAVFLFGRCVLLCVALHVVGEFMFGVFVVMILVSFVDVVFLLVGLLFLLCISMVWVCLLLLLSSYLGNFGLFAGRALFRCFECFLLDLYCLKVFRITGAFLSLCIKKYLNEYIA